MGSKLPAVKGRLFTVGLIASWYFSNIGVLLLNKYLLSNYGFRFPIFLTMCHMTACALLSYVGIVWFKMVPMQSIRSRSQFLKIAALSIIFSASVVGGNISLRYLPVSFNQAVGATTPFFTALFAYLVTFKREAWITYATLVPVVAGVIIASGWELLCMMKRTFILIDKCDGCNCDLWKIKMEDLLYERDLELLIEGLTTIHDFATIGE